MKQPNESKLSTARKLAICGAMGAGGATFCASAANADICYTDLTGNEIIFTSATQPGLDFDGDGTDDLNIVMGTYFNPAVSSSSFYLSAVGPAANRVAANSTYNGIYALGSGASISGRNFTNSFGYFQRNYTNFSNNVLFGSWPAGTKGFFGVQFDDGTGTTRFGWVEAEVTGDVLGGTFNDVQVAISGFAYAKGESIVAGQTVSAVPEPSALGLLALGGIGLLARRRRRKSA